MKVEIVRESERELEVRIDDLTIASMVTKYLQEDERVEVASFRREHPLFPDTVLYLRVKGGNPREVLADTIKKAISDVESFREQSQKLIA